jgi:crossover junction endodeoxyribonuclease RuvC
MSGSNKLILGIDPGLTNTGWAIVSSTANKIKFIDASTIVTTASDEMCTRLKQIYNKLNEVLARYKPHYAAIEMTYVNKNFGSSLKLAQARAVAMLTTSLHEIPLTEYQAKTIKQALTGVGSADKRQIISMLALLMPGIDIKDSHIADALAIAICHANHLV